MEKRNFNQWIQSFGINVIIGHRYLVLFLIGLLVIAGLLGMQRIQMDSSNEAFLPADDPLIIKNDQFKEMFGNEEFVYILVESEDVFTYDVLKYVRELSEDIEENLPYVREVTSITNVDIIDSQDNNLIIEELIKDEIPRDKGTLTQLKEKILSKKIYVDRIITRDAKKTGIIVSMDNIPEAVYGKVGKYFTPVEEENYSAEEILMANDLYLEKKEGLNIINDPRKLIAPALKVILNRHSSESIKTYATGVPLLDYETEVINSTESVWFGILALSVSVILMILLFRSFQATIGPFLVILSTLIILFGMLGWLNIKLTLLSVIVPTLILVISIAYSIHVINHFQYAFAKTGSRIEAIKYVYRESTWPIFVTALTTALGFISFQAVSMEPIKVVGLSAALGAFLTYILVMVILPILFSFGKDKKANGSTVMSKENREDKFRARMVRFADFVSHNVKFAIVLTTILVGVFLYYSFQMPITSDFMEMIGDDVDFIRETNYITDNLGALYSYEMLIEFPEEDMAKNAEVLQKIDNLGQIIDSWDNTIGVYSLTDLIKEMNMVMNNNQEVYYKVPDSSNLVSQYLLLYEMSGGEGLEDLVDFAYEKTHLTVQLGTFSNDIQGEFTKIKEYGEKNFPEGTRISIVGDIPLMIKMINELTIGQAQSILVALLVITMVMIFVLKSLKLGLLSMIPNAIPVIVITGLMGLLKFPLDMITILIAPMIIGIAVDDTVHYFIHFQEEYRRHNSYQEANRETFKKIGRALIFACVVLILGFSLFGLSQMESLVHMAILSAAGILSALAADMFITPAIMVFLKPLGKKNKNYKEREGLSNEV